MFFFSLADFKTNFPARAAYQAAGLPAVSSNPQM